jgi:nucleotide-binding universal stress UspA family protein
MEAILVGSDGSTASLGALRWADGIAQRAGAPLVAVRAGVMPARAHVSDDLHAQICDRARLELDGWCKDGDLAVTPATIVVDDDPRTALPALAAEHHADLLVIGGSGTCGLVGRLLGSVVQHLAHHPTLPLAVVPAGSPRQVRHLVVGVDGSPGSLAAVRFCARLARALEAPVSAVLAQEPFAERVPASAPGSWRRNAQRQLQEWVSPIASTGVRVSTVVDRDIHPVAALTSVLAEQPGSVAVVGTHGRGGFAALLLGRVPLELLHDTDVPIVIVPADAG